MAGKASPHLLHKVGDLDLAPRHTLHYDTQFTERKVVCEQRLERRREEGGRSLREGGSWREGEGSSREEGKGREEGCV